MHKRKALLMLALIAALMVAAGAAGAGVGYYYFFGNGVRAEANSPGTAGTTGRLSLPSLLGTNAVADTVEAASPAVVYIETAFKAKTSPFDPFLQDPFFREFFGKRFEFSIPETRHGLGSGFIISQDGYILTNDHVVNGADEIKVTVAGFDKPFKAKLVGSDYDLDLAVLKIDARAPLPLLKLGNSDDTRVGDWVIAIGNPYGLDHTVTVGVISAKGRPITIEDRHYKNLIQTDAAINPGNSGGPLLNLDGQVVGINTAINAQAQGIGFAIPINVVKEVLDELIKSGKVTRPWLGVYLQPVTPELADYFKLKEARGALVSYVFEGSPAAKAGLRRGDVIVKAGDAVIGSPDDLIEAIRALKAGSRLILLLYREGRTLYVPVTIGEKP